MQSGIKKLVLTRFSDSLSTCTLCDIFLQVCRNQILWADDVSLCFNVFDSNIKLPPSVFKKGTSDYKNKVKIIVHMPGRILDLYCVWLLNASPFCKSYAKLYYDAKHLERYPKFLEYTLHALICSNISYICKWTEMTCWKVQVLGYCNSSSCRMNPCIFL